MSKLNTRIILIIVLLLGFWLRLTGIEFGLPFAYHPDEHQYILPAVDVVSGDFEPVAYYNPALYSYTIGFVYTVTYLGLRLFNAFPPFFNLDAAWSDQMQIWVTGLIYLARYTGVAVGTVTILLVYHLGRRAYGRETGVGAAIIFGLTFLPAREAHFAVSDTPLALGVAVTLYLCLMIIKRGSLSDYLWVGVVFGLSTSVKYSAGLLVLPVGMAHLFSGRYDSLSKRLINIWLLVLSGLTAIVSYLATSPYTLLDWVKFRANFSENIEFGKNGFQGLDLDPAGGALFYLKSLIWGLGWPIFLLFLAAVIFAIWRRRTVDITLLSLPLVGFIYMQRQEIYFARWLMLFLPAIAVLSAETVRVAVRQINSRRYNLQLAIIILFTLPSSYMAVQADLIFSRLDTRTEAMLWIGDNIPHNSVIAAELLSPPWGPPLAMPGLAVGPYNFAPVPTGGVAEMELSQFQALGVEYIVASSFYYARPLRDKEQQARVADRMKNLDNKAELIALFQPYKSEYDQFLYHDQLYGPANDTLYRNQPGPIIKIYRLP